MKKFNNNDTYIEIAREILSIPDKEFTLDEEEEMLYEVFETYYNLGYYVDLPYRDKDSDILMVFKILRAGLGCEEYSHWDEYNIFKD